MSKPEETTKCFIGDNQEFLMMFGQKKKKSVSQISIGN